MPRERDDRPRPSYEGWREGLSVPDEEYEEHGESVVLDQLRMAKLSSRGVRLILGEPGAGKSTLLHEWYVRWMVGLVAPQLGLRVPVLVRVREIRTECWTGLPEEIADYLWKHVGQSTAMAVAKDTVGSQIFGLPLRLFTPVWLLDGLDEARDRSRRTGDFGSASRLCLAKRWQRCRHCGVPAIATKRLVDWARVSHH